MSHRVLVFTDVTLVLIFTIVDNSPQTLLRANILVGVDPPQEDAVFENVPFEPLIIKCDGLVLNALLQHAPSTTALDELHCDYLVLILWVSISLCYAWGRL